MTISTCVAKLISERRIKQHQGNEVQRYYDANFKLLKGQMDEAAASDIASERAVRQMQAAINRRSLLAAKAIETQERINADMKSFNEGKSGEKIDPRAADALFTSSDRARFPSLEGQYRAIKQRMMGLMAQILKDHHPDIMGRIRDTGGLENVGREVMGEKTGDANAAAKADAWTKATEMGRQRINAAGGDIGKLEGGYLPQFQSPELVNAAGFERWHDDLMNGYDGTGVLNLSTMIDRDTGAPFTREKLDEVLRKSTYRGIVTRGWDDREPGAAGTSALANRGTDPRFLHFKSFDAWNWFNDRYGEGDLFNAMNGLIEHRAKTAAALERFGPNPEQGVKFAKGLVMKSALENSGAGSLAETDAKKAGIRVDSLWNVWKGTTARAYDPTIAAIGDGLRDVQIWSKLGSAPISQWTDIPLNAAARLASGMPVGRVFADYARLISPRGAAERMVLAREGIGTEEWQDRHAAIGRMDATPNAAAGRSLAQNFADYGKILRGTGDNADEAFAERTAAGLRMLTKGAWHQLGLFLDDAVNPITGRIAAGVMKASGSVRWMQLGRQAWGAGFLNMLTHTSSMPWEALPEDWRQTLYRGGFDSASWDELRATPHADAEGAKWLLPSSVENQQLQDQLRALIASHADTVLPLHNMKTQAWMERSIVARKGTVPGEIVRSMMMFKSFGIAIQMAQFARVMAMTPPKAARYAAFYVAGMGAIGLIEHWAKEIVAGNDPASPWDKDGKFNWGLVGQAFLQGGGLGLGGDFLKSQTDSYGQSMAKFFAGPVIDDADKWAQPLMIKPGRHPETLAARREAALFRAANGDIPGGTLWYGRLAFRRMVLDQIQQNIDPNYAHSWAVMEQHAREQGTSTYWHPGQTAPARAPDFGNAIGHPSAPENQTQGTMPAY